MKGWDLKYIQQLKDEGRIRDYQVIGTKKPENNSHNQLKNIPKRSKEKDWLNWNLELWAKEQQLQLKREFEFYKERHWRFDWCFPDLMVAVEYEGIMNGGKAHSSVSGILRDIEKYNTAQSLGWRVIRITAKDYRTILQQLKNYLP